MIDELSEVRFHRPEDEDMTTDRMLTLIDLDQAFIDSPDATVINDEQLSATSGVTSKYSKQIYNVVVAPSDFIPSCKCGRTRGIAKLGLICPYCGNPVSSQFVDNISQNMWIRIPDNMPPVLHPVWYLVLGNWTKVGKPKVSVLDVILDPRMTVPEDMAPYIKGRGFTYLYEHADEVLDMLLYEYPKTSKKPNVEMCKRFREFYRDVMFTRHLPILHNSLHPLKSNGGTLYYADASSKEILTAVINLNAEALREHTARVSTRKMDIALFNIYHSLVEDKEGYYTSLINKKLGSKHGLLRKHDFGSRVHFSFRTVVSPQHQPYPMDEVLLPWGIMVQSLKLPILNFLMHRMHMNMSTAYTVFMNSLTKYDKRVDDCMTQFIQEYPGGRLCVLVGRNPTLAYGSIMQLFVREYKKDPSDETMAINACDCEPANIDFDGDKNRSCLSPLNR